jgi:hypothetical protein
MKRALEAEEAAKLVQHQQTEAQAKSDQEAKARIVEKIRLTKAKAEFLKAQEIREAAVATRKSERAEIQKAKLAKEKSDRAVAKKEQQKTNRKLRKSQILEKSNADAEAEAKKKEKSLALANAEAKKQQKKDLAERKHLLEVEAISSAPTNPSPHVTFHDKEQEKQELLLSLRNGTAMKDPLVEKRKLLPKSNLRISSSTKPDLLSTRNQGIRVTSNDNSAQDVASRLPQQSLPGSSLLGGRGSQELSSASENEQETPEHAGTQNSSSEDEIPQMAAPRRLPRRKKHSSQSSSNPLTWTNI